MEGNRIRMGKTLGIDRALARRIKKMNTKELDGYLDRVTSKSFDNGYEEGLVNGVALAGQSLDKILKKHVEDGTLTEHELREITQAVGVEIAKAPEKAMQQMKEDAAATKVEKMKGAK